MGAWEEYQRRKKELKENKEADKNSSSGSMSYYEQRKKELGYGYEVNQEFIDTFVKDTNSFFGNFGEGKETPSYGTATSTLKDLTSRNNAIKVWLKKNKNNLDENTYNSLSSTFDQFESSLNEVNSFYSQFDSEDGYNQWNSAEKERQAIMGAEDFELYRDKGKNVSNPSWKDSLPPVKIFGLTPFGDGDDVNNMVTFAENNSLEAIGTLGTNQSSSGDQAELVNLINGFMTDDEKEIYNYYIGKGDKKKADEYLTNLTDVLRQRQGGKIAEQIDNNALELIFSGIAGLDQFASGIKNIDNFIMGTEADPTSSIQYAQSIAGANNEGVWKVANNLVSNTSYMLPSIMASTVANMIVPGSGTVVGLATFGAPTIGNAYAEMRNLGYDEGQSRLYASLVGAAEIGLQYALGGIGKLGGKATGQAITKFVSKVDNAFARTAIQLGGKMGGEALEEGLQTVLEPWFKSIATGVDFDAPNAGEVLYSSLIGALSAGMLEGGGVVASNVALHKQGKALKKQGLSVEALADLGKDETLFSADTVAHRLAGKVNENTGAYTIARLFNEVNAQLTEQNQNDIIRSLERKGVRSKDAKTIASTLAQVVAGAELTEAQANVLENNPDVAKTFQDVIINPNSTVNQRMMGLREAFKTDSSKTSQEATGEAKNVPANENASTEVNAENEAINVSESGKTINATTGEEISIKEIASIENGEVTLRLDNGETVNARDVEFSSEEEGLIYEAVADMDVAKANDFVQGFKAFRNAPVATPQSAESYLLGFNEAYTYGRYGIPDEALERDGIHSKSLFTEQKRLAYTRGKIDAVAKVEADQGKVKTTKAKGKITYDVDIKGSLKKGDIRTESLNMIKFFNENFSHTNIHIFASYVDENGRRVYRDKDGKVKKAPNGMYFPDGSIALDLNAGSQGQGLILDTFSHELTHRAKDLSPELYKAYADFLFENYSKNKSVEELIQYEIDFAKKQGRTLSYEDAYDEAVARASERMLVDVLNGTAQKKITEQAAKSSAFKKAFEKIKEFFAELVKSIQSLYNKIPPESESAQIVHEMKDVAEKLQEMWLDMVMDAGTKVKVSAEATTKYSENYSYKNYSASDYYTNGKIYSYDFLTAQKDMVSVELPKTGELANKNGKIDDAKVVSEGIKNALSEGVERDGKVYVKNIYTGRELRIDNSTIKHGLDGTYNRHLTNARIGSVIGSVVKNAIPINGLKNASEKAIGTYAMASYCYDSLNRQFVAIITVEQHTGNVDNFELYDVAHAVSGRQKKGSQVDTKSQGVYPIEATTISIADLLEIVNSTHQSILSEDVLARFGETRNPKGSYSDKVLFSDRDSLGNELSEEQQEFFKDSKVRDENGNLLICTHNSPSKFTVFDEAMIGDFLKFGRGFYFFKGIPKSVPKEFGENQHKVYLNIKNPFNYDTVSKKYIVDMLEKSGYDYDKHFVDSYNIEDLKYDDFLYDFLWDALKNQDPTEVFSKMLQNAGFDGILSEDEVVAFYPEQIKLTTNKKPTSNPDIRYSDRDSQGNTLSVEQQNFFRDSKVRDKKGNLLVMYHGTTANFNTFKKGDIGFHFGTKGAARGRVGYGKNTIIKEVYLNITNPIVFNEDLGSWDADYRLTQELFERGILTRDEAEMVLLSDDKTYRRPTEKANKKLSALLQEKGYDGIEYRNTFESKKDSTSYIAFNSNQIKELTNQVPTSDPDIRYSDRDSESELTQLREDYSKARELENEAKKKLDSIGEYPRMSELQDAIVSKETNKELLDELIADYDKWRKESGYSEAYENRQSLDKKSRDLRAEVERMEERLSKALREKKYSEDEVKAVVQKAVRKYHTTPYLNRASYLLTTGSMLDFSEGQGYRVQDHREISEILDLPDYAQYSDGMIVFMNMGNIRLQTYGIDISAMPNSKQISSLRDIISKVMREYDEFTVDFSKPNGNSDGSVTYPKGVASSKIISDIKNYFETGNIPEYEDSLSQFLYSDRDSSYMDAVNKGDMETAQKMVDEAAKKAGYDVKAYHGTNKFGFTKADVSYSDDGISFFATDSKETAGTYSGVDKVKRISDSSKQLTDDDLEKMENDIRSISYDLADYCSRTLGIRGWVEPSYFKKELDDIFFNLEHGLTNSIGSDATSDFTDFCDNLFYEFEKAYYDSNYDSNNNPYLEEDEWVAWDDWEVSEEHDEIADKFYSYVGQINGKLKALDYDSNSGMYDLYANTGGHLILECNGSSWNNIKAKNLPESRWNWNTRKVAKYAKDYGFTGVTFKDLKDSGNGNYVEPATVYIFFNPQEQVKSADPVTYDDDGNVIPLSERFNAENNDIRYSDRDTGNISESFEKFAKQSQSKYNNFWDWHSKVGTKYIVGEIFSEYFYEPDSTSPIHKLIDVIRDVLPSIEYSVSENSESFDTENEEMLYEVVSAVVEDYIRHERDLGILDFGQYANLLKDIIDTSKKYATKKKFDAKELSWYVVNTIDTYGLDNIITIYNKGAKNVSSEEKKADVKRIIKKFKDYKKTLSKPTETTPTTKAPKQKGVAESKPAKAESMSIENAHVDYRDHDSVSNRSLLANALESVAQNDIEKNKLKQYKDKIALIESEQAKLGEIREKANALRFTKGRTPSETKTMRDLDAEATQIANRISTYDKQLLNLESTSALKNVLEREKTMLRKKLEQKGKEAVRKQKEKDAKTARELMTRYQESRKNAIEGRHKTEVRNKIKKVVSDLNKLLLNPTKEQHVPIGLQKVVAEALDVINMDTMNAEERVAYYNDLISKSSDPDEIEMLTKKRDFFEYRDMSFKDRITALKNAYQEFKESDDPLIRNAHNEAIEDLIKNTADSVGNKSLKDMSYEQLESVHNMYKAILATVRNSNKMFKEGIQATITETSESVKVQVKEVGGHKDRVNKLMKPLKQFGWNMLKPVTAMKVIGSKTFEKLFDNVRAGEDTWAVDVNEAKNFYQDMAKKYNFKKWDFKKHYNFKDSRGNDFSLTIEQIMSLYAYSKRSQADKHLELGGFIFDDAIEVTEKGKLGIPMKYEVNDANPYRINVEIMSEIASTLTEEQRAFADEMQAYLSDVMGAKGNEVSLAMYDIKLYNEKYYFPLKSSRYFREFDSEQGANPKIKNSGFTKKTVPQAGNPIVLSNFMDVWASHVNDMSMYHAFALPLEDFMRVYNYSSVAGGYDSVQQYIKNAYGSQANQYIERLMVDLNGGARVDSTAGVINKGLSLFKKASVFASLSVAIQQPSAIARATAYINPKYFATSASSAINFVKHKKVWEEIKKYAPVAVIKEMGYFDTGMGRSTVDWIKGNQTVKDKVDDALSKAPAMADELSWSYIWEAVKRETKATTNLAEGSEEFLKKSGERFTEIITNTQVYDSVLSRSGMMRSKDTGMKMATAFMAEPTTTVNMMVDGILQGKRGNKKFTASTVGAVSASIILNSILVSLVYAARDDDEDETYAEKYIGSLTTELVDGFNPLTYIPFVKDIWSIAQGYDVERSDMSVISDLWATVEGLFNEDKKGWDKVTDVAGAISSMFGIPLKNLLRDGEAMYNLGKTVTSGTPTTGTGIGDSIEDAFKNSIPLWSRFNESETKSDKLYDAVLSGDQNQIDRVKGQFKDEKAIESALRQGLRENDTRIKEAAQARFDGDMSEYTRIAKEIIAEGNFSQDTVVSAINAELTAIKNKQPSEETEEEEEKDEVTSIYKASDISSAFESGDNATALEIIQDLIDTKVANGMEEKEAKSSLRSSMTTYWKPLYKKAYQSGNTSEMNRIRQILYASGLYGNANEVVKTVQNWLRD